MTLVGWTAAVVLSAFSWLKAPVWVSLLAILCSIIWWRCGPRRYRSFGIMCALACIVMGIRAGGWAPSSGQSSARSARLIFEVVADPVRASSYGQPVVRYPSLITMIQPASLSIDRVSVIRPEESDLMAVGTRWASTGRLEPKQETHQGLMYSSWRFIPDDDSLVQMDETQVVSWRRWAFGFRDRLQRKIEHVLQDQPTSSSILQALLLGNRAAMDPMLLDRFSRTGLIHIFAISGLHIGMLTGMAWWLLRMCGITTRYRMWFILPFLILFVWFSGFQASSLRALMMVSCALAAPWFYRKVHVLNSLCLSCILILLVAPSQLMDIGFQFSFVLVAGLVCLVDKDVQWVLSRVGPDPWAPEVPWRTWLRRHVLPFVTGGLVVSGWSLLLSAPLTSYHFNMFSPVSFLGNLVAVPLVFGLLGTGFLCLPFLMLPFSWGEILFQIPTAFAEALLSWTQWMERIPLGWHWVTSPAGWLVSGTYLFLLLSLRVGWRKPCLIGILSLWMVHGTHRLVEMQTTELLVLPGGRGQSFLLKQAGRRPLLIDAGDRWSGWRISKILKERGIDHLGGVFLTHPDPAHLGGLEMISADRKLGPVMVFSGDRKAKAFESFSPILLRQGKIFNLEGWSVQVVYPDEGDLYPRTDERSLVVRFVREDQAVLMMGGAGQRVEERLLQNKIPLASRIVCAGNPRNEERVHADFLEHVHPEQVVFSGISFSGDSLEQRTSEQRVHSYGIDVIRASSSEVIPVILDGWGARK